MDNTEATGTRANPWHVTSVSRCPQSGGIRVQGTNDYNGGSEFWWTLGAGSFKDPAFVAKRYDFSGSTWTSEAREAFRHIVSQAKALRAY